MVFYFGTAFAIYRASYKKNEKRKTEVFENAEHGIQKGKSIWNPQSN